MWEDAKKDFAETNSALQILEFFLTFHSMELTL